MPRLEEMFGLPDGDYGPKPEERVTLPPTRYREMERNEIIKKGDVFWGCDPPGDPPKLHPSLSIGYTPAHSAHGYRYFTPDPPLPVTMVQLLQALIAAVRQSVEIATQCADLEGTWDEIHKLFVELVTRAKAGEPLPGATGPIFGQIPQVLGTPGIVCGRVRTRMINIKEVRDQPYRPQYIIALVDPSGQDMTRWELTEYTPEGHVAQQWRLTEVTPPELRCGECEACRYVESTKTIVLSHSAPSGPGIAQPEADLWNATLRNNPCLNPKVPKGDKPL